MTIDNTPTKKETMTHTVDKTAPFAYLERLRESGVVNMYGAGPYLRDKFGLTKREAKAVLLAWIDSKRQTSDDGQGAEVGA